MAKNRKAKSQTARRAKLQAKRRAKDLEGVEFVRTVLPTPDVDGLIGGAPWYDLVLTTIESSLDDLQQHGADVLGLTVITLGTKHPSEPGLVIEVKARGTVDRLEVPTADLPTDAEVDSAVDEVASKLADAGLPVKAKPASTPGSAARARREELLDRGEG